MVGERSTLRDGRGWLSLPTNLSDSPRKALRQAENATLVTDLITGLRERGVDVTRPILAVIDGSKALSGDQGRI